MFRSRRGSIETINRDITPRVKLVIAGSGEAPLATRLYPSPLEDFRFPPLDVEGTVYQVVRDLERDPAGVTIYLEVLEEVINDSAERAEIQSKAQKEAGLGYLDNLYRL